MKQHYSINTDLSSMRHPRVKVSQRVCVLIPLSHWAMYGKVRISLRRPQEMAAWNCESEGQFSVETPGCWRWDTETLLRKTGLREKGYMCWRQEDWMGGATKVFWSPEDSAMSLGCQTWSCRIWCFSWWVLVLLWSGLSLLWPHYFCGGGDICSIPLLLMGVMFCFLPSEGCLESHKRLRI